jgi:DNA-binding CsgD family transcriptional regulator
MTDSSPESNPERDIMNRLLRQMARDKAASAKWNTQLLIVIYIVLIVVLVLQAEDINSFLVGGVAAVGLGVLWLLGWMRASRLEKKFFEEEVPKYQRMIVEAKEGGSDGDRPEPKEEIPLTKREIQILTLIVKGEMNKEIALSLNVSQNTVRNQVSQILRKLNVKDRTSAAVLALSHGWIKDNHNENGHGGQ